MVAYRNTRTGRVVRMDAPLPSMDRSARWERVGDAEAAGPVGPAGESLAPWPEPDPDSGGEFDPSDRTVKQVNEYLAGVDLRQRERVLQAEAEGRGRRGILSGPYSDLSGV